MPDKSNPALIAPEPAPKVPCRLSVCGKPFEILVRIGVACNLVAFFGNANGDVSIMVDHLSQHEKGRMDLVLLEHVQKLRRKNRWSVIKGERTEIFFHVLIHHFIAADDASHSGALQAKQKGTETYEEQDDMG